MLDDSVLEGRLELRVDSCLTFAGRTGWIRIEFISVRHSSGVLLILDIVLKKRWSIIILICCLPLLKSMSSSRANTGFVLSSKYGVPFEKL